jgi:hypothetical protein
VNDVRITGHQGYARGVRRAEQKAYSGSLRVSI